MTPPGAVLGEHRRQGLALEGQLPVGIVLEDPEVVLGRQRHQSLALRGREGAAGRVVEVGDHVGEGDRALLEGRLQRVDVDAVRLQRHRHELDPELAQQQQGAVIGGLLDGDPGARLQEVGEEHRTGLERAVGDHHLVGLQVAVALGDPLAQPRMPDPDAVGERPLPVGLQRPRRRLPHRLGGQDVGAGGAPGEADRLGGHRQPSLATASGRARGRVQSPAMARRAGAGSRRDGTPRAGSGW